MQTSNTTKPLIAAVDDEQINLDLMRIMLRKTDFDYIGIQKSDQAIEILEKNPPTIILSDVMMPRMNGYELCAQIKANDQLKDIPVIFLTSMVTVDHKVKGFEAGGVDYVAKPFNEHELLARVRTHIALVTAREKVIKQSNDLKRDNDLKDRLFSIIGHDLRSPLSAIKMQLDFIQRGIINPKDDNFMGTTVQNLASTTDEAFNLLDNLLGWARLESGVLSIIKEEVNLGSLIEQTVRLQKMALDLKDIELKTNISDSEITCFADMNMVKTVLRNLLSNAIKFTPKGGVIEFKVQKKDTNVNVEITDSGIGISSENLEKILNPKEHFSKEGTEKEAGTGLGLVLCQDFIRKNGSELRIESEIGQGSTFSFSLPLTA